MIVKVPKPGITDYELKYFMEADTPARKNMRKITLADSGKATVNGVERDADDVGVDNDDLPEDDDTENTDTPETDDDTDVDDIDLDDDDFDDEDLGDDEGDDDTAGDDNDIATDDEETGDDTGDGEDSAGGTDDDTGDNEGGNDDVAVDNEGDGGEDDDNADNTDGDDSGEGDDKQQTPEEKQALIQKFNLFTKMRNLHETVGKYIEKINMLIAYNTDNTTAYQAVCDKLDEMRSYLYEYMLVKFDGAKYVESMLFYHRATTLIYLILEELEAIQVAGDEKKRKPSKKSDKKTDSKEKSK